jgi:Zn-dependent protease
MKNPFKKGGQSLQQRGFPVVLIIILLLMMIINTDFLDNPKQWLWRVLLMLPAIIIGLTVHEFAHAFAANMLGDPTPKNYKRVSLNPIRHIDPVGFVALFLVGFGWGKPVPVNPYAFRKRPRLCNIIVDLAGVFTNFVVAFIFMGLLKVFANVWSTDLSYSAQLNIGYVIQYVVTINLVLMIFNLLPIPPLDGFGLITEIFNLRGKPAYARMMQIGPLLLLMVILFNISSRIIQPGVEFFWNLLYNFYYS